jgi:gas vesicle protein
MVTSDFIFGLLLGSIGGFLFGVLYAVAIYEETDEEISRSRTSEEASKNRAV